MATERITSPEQLIGMSVLDVICLLPTFSWYIEDFGRRCDVKISRVTVVDYDTWKPRETLDLYDGIDVEPGIPIKKEELISKLGSKPGRTVGLTSSIWLDEDEYRAGLYKNADNPWVHLPLIDADLEFLEIPEEDAARLLKEEIIKKTEIEEGVILRSGERRRNHFHFIGTKRLLNQDQLPTFIGLCLNMLGPGKKQLVDTKWAGHTLTPMKYMMETDREIDWSAYDFGTRFASLRVGLSEKKPYSELPTVIDVL